MRISAGARGPSRNGGNIDVHTEIPIITLRRQLRLPIANHSAGTFEIRDAVFQELIRMSSASNYREELVTRAGGLLSLGLLEEQATKVATVFVPH